jgi:hypothetical protein
MAIKFKRGDKVTQVVKPISGEVVNVQVVDGDHLQFEVAFVGEDGEPHAKWFREDEVDLTPEAPAA